MSCCLLSQSHVVFCFKIWNNSFTTKISHGALNAKLHTADFQYLYSSANNLGKLSIGALCFSPRFFFLLVETFTDGMASVQVSGGHSLQSHDVGTHKKLIINMICGFT